MNNTSKNIWIVTDEASPDSMNFEELGGVKIFRPRASNEVKLRIEAEKNLRSEFAIGKYTDKQTINQILQHQFGFFISFLDQLLPMVASLDFLTFLLDEYDKTSEIDRLYKSDQLDNDDKERWASLGPTVRRAIKYLAERVILFLPAQMPDASDEEIIESTEKIWICVEELVRHYILSDQTFMVFPDDTIFEIHPEGSLHYWTLEISNQCATEIQERTRIDTANRDRFIPSPSFDLESSKHESIIGNAFRNTMRISYVEVLGTLRTFIDGAEPPQDGFPIPFVHREQTLTSMASHLNFSQQVVEQTIAGFSISKSDLENEGREIWKPKQEYRAFRRGVFEAPHSTGTHLLFSKSMAKECAIQLVGGVVFKDIPPEWRNDEINLALETLSNEAGKWFEQIALDNLETVGIFGVKSIKRGIGQQENRIIPPEVGEIDFLGYSPNENLLVLCECKMVRGGFEPKYFRDEIQEFVTSRKSYFKKFQRKIDWVRNNVNGLSNALMSVREYDAPIKPTHIATAVITLYPSIVSCFANDFPCVTITEIMMGYEKKHSWPFDSGIYNC